MGVPNGYNTVPSFMYMEQIASILGAAHTVYMVDSNSGVDTNDGKSWETAIKKISVAMALSHADIAAADKTGYAARNVILYKGDQTATAEGEDLTALAQKTDIIGIGSTDWKSKPQLIGNIAVASTTSYMGCKFHNIMFKGPVLVGGDIITLTGQHGIGFYGCEFMGDSTTPATAAVLATACVGLEFKKCVSKGAFSDAVIELGAGQADDFIVEDCLIQGANMGIDIGAATFAAGKFGMIKDNVFATTLACINDASSKVYVINNRGTTLAAEGVGLAGAIVCNIKLAQGNYFTTSDKNSVAYAPIGTGA
jgi:hypothetical protein